MTTREVLIKTMQDNVRAAFDTARVSNKALSFKGMAQAMAEAQRIAERLVNEFGMTYEEVEALQIV